MIKTETVTTLSFDANGKEVYVQEEITSEETAVTLAASSILPSILDEEARARGFDDMDDIAKFVGYDNPYRAAAEELGCWCANCWLIIENTDEAYPGTVKDLIESLPKL